MEMQLIFVCWLYILLLCWIHSQFCVWVWTLKGFQYINSYQLQMDNFTSSFPVWMFFISFSCRSLWLELPVHCWIQVVKVGIFAIPNLKAFSLSPLEFDVCCGFFTYGFAFVEVFLVECFYSEKGIEFCQMFLSIEKDDHVVFFPSFCWWWHITWISILLSFTLVFIRQGFVVFVFCHVFGLGFSNAGLREWFGKCTLLFRFLEKLEKIDILL